MNKTRKPPIYRFEPVLMDLGHRIKPGTLVTKSSKAPCLCSKLARPFTWAYDAETGDFLGMVCRNSLVPVRGGTR